MASNEYISGRLFRGVVENILVNNQSGNWEELIEKFIKTYNNLLSWLL